MKLGTHVHYAKTGKCCCSAKPDYAWDGCGGHFPKSPLSQKLFIGFVEETLSRLKKKKLSFQEKYCRYNHTIVSAILEGIFKNGGHFQSNTSISETKRHRSFKVDSMYRFCGVSISDK